MSHQIDPLILQKLQAFSARRRKLIVRRGICAAVATLLVAMMAVAFIDWLFVLPDAVRWTLSGAAYLAVIVVEWRSCWRLLIHMPGPRRLARLVEHAEPKLREDLLSAVELGETKGEVFDSEQFRALVQSDVAARVEKLDVEQLLPAQLVRRYVMLAAGLGVACLVAFGLTGFQFGTLMMRALLPMANFARVSKVKVKVIEPMPAEMRVPQGDTLPLIVELSGQRVNKATLETFTPSGGREVVPMNPLGNDRFSATIQVGRENVLYRVRAGDGLTKKYQLEAVARPAVVEFQKGYTYPAYSKLDPKSVTEENGDLAALEGSQVELRLRTNQKVRDAELRIEQGKKNTVVPLTVQGDTLVATVPLDTSGIYRVHLVGAESGFENKFSPEYELRAEPDLVPQVELELPKQDLILPSNEIVDVQGSAADDFALAKVAQLVRINEGAWKEFPLPMEAGAKTQVERRWDLFDQGVKPGDLVTTKLVATDLKGNKAESRPLQVTITSAGFESKRLQTLVGQRALYEAMKAQFASADELAKRAGEARKEFERRPEGDPERAQPLLAMNPGLDELFQKTGDTMKLLQEALAEAAPGHQTGNLAMLGQLQTRLQASLSQNARHPLAVAGAHPAVPIARDLARDVAEAVRRTESRARQMMEMQRVFLAAEEIDVFYENVHVVAQEQERLKSLAHRSGTDAAKWVPVANRLRVVLAELRGLEELAGQAAEHVQGAGDWMRNFQKTLNKRRTTIETALASKPGAELLAPIMELSNAVAETERTTLDVRRKIRGAPVERQRDLFRETEAIYAQFEQLRQETERVHRNDKIPVEIGDALVEARWQEALEVFKGIGDVEERRPDADTFFVNDVRLVTRVLGATHERYPGKPGPEFAKELQAIDRNFRVLESGHEIGHLVEGYRRLAVGERWEIYNPKARTMNAADWVWLGERLRAMPEEFGRALNFDERRVLMQEAQKILWQTPNQPFAQALRREMEERAHIARVPVSAVTEAAAVADYLQQALDLFRQPMSDARKELAKLAPTLADTMKQLAKKTEALKEETTNQAQQAHEKLPEEARADARQALAQQQKLNEKIDALKDALRADANQQDILQADGRERARDADDALAMLKEPPVRAEEDLALAAKSEQTAMQEQALNQAAEQQQKLSKALEQLAEHYAAMEQGKPEETRTALRKTEQENGIKEQLDQQYARAAELAKMAQSTPEELLAQLEQALPRNPQMQQELSAISQNTLKSAEELLKKASAQENAVAQNVQKMAADEKATAAMQPTQPPANQPAANPANPPTPPQASAQTSPPQSAPPSNPQAAPNAPSPAAPQTAAANQPPPNGQPANQGQPPAQSNPMLAQAAQQQKPIGDQTGQAASEISRAGRHEERMQNKIAGEQLQKLGEQVQAVAETQVPNAQQALQQAQQAAQAQPAVNAADAELQKALGQLTAAANPGEAAMAEPGGQSPAPAPGEQPAGNSQAAPPAQGAKSAAATAPEAPSTQGQPAPPSSASPSTAQAGPKPGQPSQPGQMAQASPSGQAPNQPAAAPDGAMPGEPRTIGEMAAGLASPQEQVWMARTLDALDAALNAPANSGPEGQQQAQAGQQQAGKPSGQTSQAQQTAPGQSDSSKQMPTSNSMAQAQSAMAAAAQAAAAQARAQRSEAGAPNQPGQPPTGGLQALSKGGVQQAEGNGPRSALAEAKNKAGDWGKLPKQMAEELTQGQREGIAGEYRNQVETYYRAIAEKSKKQ